MFNNIGKKIKVLAWVICIIGMVASLIGAIALWISAGTSYYGVNAGLILAGFVTLIVGCVASWVGSFFCYGFGQLIDKTEENNYHLNQIGRMLYDIQNKK